jgi:hypothetical protein
MSEINQSSSIESTTDIRIVCINTDKTRRMIGSETVYQVYFELSGSPTQAWRTVFEQEWKTLHSGQSLSLQETSIDRSFLLMNCPLEDIAKQLPVLKKAVAAANAAYVENERKQAMDQKVREDIWKDERKTVEDTVQSLHFD